MSARSRKCLSKLGESTAPRGSDALVTTRRACRSGWLCVASDGSGTDCAARRHAAASARCPHPTRRCSTRSLRVLPTSSPVRRGADLRPLAETRRRGLAGGGSRRADRLRRAEGSGGPDSPWSAFDPGQTAWVARQVSRVCAGLVCGGWRAQGSRRRTGHGLRSTSERRVLARLLGAPAATEDRRRGCHMPAASTRAPTRRAAGGSPTRCVRLIRRRLDRGGVVQHQRDDVGERVPARVWQGPRRLGVVQSEP
jgi:hypothetical protein